MMTPTTTTIRPTGTKPTARGGVLLSLALALWLASGGAPLARGSVLQWDANGTLPVNGGSGNWNTTSNFWYNGGSYQAWVNNNNVQLLPFDYNPYTLTLTENITVGGSGGTALFRLENGASSVINNVEGSTTSGKTLTIDNTSVGTAVAADNQGITLTINSPVILRGDNPGVRHVVRSPVTINGVISQFDATARGFQIANSTTLTLNNGNNTFAGGVYIESGKLVLGHDNGAGTGPITFGASGITIEAANGNRTIANDLVTANWNYTINFSGANNLTFTDQFDALQAFNSSVPFTVDVAAAGASVTFNNFSAVQHSSGSAGFRKTGLGTMILDGTFTQSGTMTYAINAGTLLVNTVSPAISNLTVSSSGALGGNGTINFAAGNSVTINGGTITPGASIGTFTINSGLAFTNAPSYVYEAEDLVDVNGALTLPEEQWNVELIGGVGRSLQAGGSLVLFTFNSLANPGTYYTGALNPIYTNWDHPLPAGPLSVSILGNSVILNGVSVVPEPSSIFLLAVGGWVLLRVGRRRAANGSAESGKR